MGDGPATLQRNAGDAGGGVLIGDRHRMAVGVDQLGVIDNQGNVTFPEDQVAARKGDIRRDFVAQLLLLITVAGAGDATCQQGGLRKTRAINPRARVPTPKVGCVEEAFGHQNRVVMALAERQ